MFTCNPLAADRRRTFWTHGQCGVSVSHCGSECATYGLKYVNQSNGRSIDNTGWLASLIVTILLTDGRSLNDDCNKQVAFKGGHWSESFRTDGLPIGTDLRRVPSQTSVANYVEEIRARAEAALGKLVVLNIASSITVNVKYNGNNVFYLDIESKTNEGLLVKLGLNGTRLTDAFAWNV